MRLIFDRHAFEDLSWWVANDPKTARKLMALIEETGRSPFTGRGKPEPLKHELAGCWSRRIDQEHRLVYAVLDDSVRILSCRTHYRK